MKALNFKFPLIFVISIIILSFKSYSQTDFYQDYTDDYTVTNTSGICNSCNISNIRFWPSNNIPFANSPVKIVRIDFNVFQDGSGGGNFVNTPDPNIGTTRLNNIVTYINNFYDHNAPNNIPPAGVTVNDLPKEFIQFELGGIYFYNQSQYWRSSNTGELQTIIQNDPARDINASDKRIQFYLTEGFHNGSVNTILVTNGGSGYTSAPTVVFNPPSTTKATAQISGGQVTSINIDVINSVRQGGNYGNSSGTLPNNGIPIITLTGGGGTGATAEVFEMNSAAASASGPSCNALTKSVVIAYDAFRLKAPLLDKNGGDYATATTLAHELGHSLDLIHTYTGGNTAANCTSNASDPMYLDDIYGLPV